jgi:fumarylacetoacetase
MADRYTSHFSIENVPYGVASSPRRPTPRCATRINDDVIFLAELADHHSFKKIPVSLSSIFREGTLNAFAALAKDIQSQVRSAVQEAHRNGLHKDCSEDVKEVTMHNPVHTGDFTDYSASANHVLNAGEAVQGVRTYPPGFLKYPVGYAGRCSSITISGAPVRRLRCMDCMRNIH